MFSKILVPKILIIAKNPQILDILLKCLSNKEIQIEKTKSLKTLHKKSYTQYSLIIADLDLETKISQEIISYIRSKTIFIPILIIGKNKLGNKRIAYKLKASLYHDKPIDCELLCAQIACLSLLFHHNMILDLVEIKLDLASKGFIFKNKFIALTGREFEVLLILIRAGGRVLNSEKITQLCICNDNISESAIHTAVSRIRSKLKNKLSEPIIITRPQAGYCANPKYLQNIHLRIKP